MNRKICIATPVDYSNFGNRLQNYAVHEICKKFDLNPVTVATEYAYVGGCIPKNFVLKIVSGAKLQGLFSKSSKLKKINKSMSAYLFTRRWIDTKYIYNVSGLRRELKTAKFFGIGGDQVLSPYWREHIFFATFPGESRNQKVCFAPSFGSDCLPEEYINKMRPELADIEYPALREKSGCNLYYDMTGRRALRICDPVVMLTALEWNERIDQCAVGEKNSFVLVYFLGEPSQEYLEYIQNIAADRKCRIVDVSLNSFSKEAGCDPMEFVTYIRDAEIVFTDSFHAVMLSLIMNTNLLIFSRIGGEAMNTRITELIERYAIVGCSYPYAKKVKLNEVGKYDFNAVNEILAKERAVAYEYYRKVLQST